jgi:hypothetical protein
MRYELALSREWFNAIQTVCLTVTGNTALGDVDLDRSTAGPRTHFNRSNNWRVTPVAGIERVPARWQATALACWCAPRAADVRARRRQLIPT